MPNIYEIKYNKQRGSFKRTGALIQIPAESEQMALVRFGQLNPDSSEFPYDECVLEILHIKKV